MNRDLKKKIFKYLTLVMIITIIFFIILNIYYWFKRGNQTIKISTASKAFTNSELYVSTVALKHGENLDAKVKIKLLDDNGRKVKGSKVAYEGNNNAIISVPKIDAGNYFIEAEVSSKVGKDKIKKSIYLSNGNQKNVTINFDKGIYKPGDTVNFRALITAKENDIPIEDTVKISIYDGNDNRVYYEDVKTSEYGILSGKFTLANEINSGIYRLVVENDGVETTKQFKVNPYITPKYEVQISYDKENYLVDDIAKITIHSQYFFGEDASGTKYTIYIDDEMMEELVADNNGNANFEYKIKEAKVHSVKVEAIDSSNYFVETSSNFSAGTDLFEIELLPEYGDLINNKKNDVYIFTKKADGTPVKTYVEITSDKFTKQVATDENGIGRFSIDIDDNNSNSYDLQIKNSYSSMISNNHKVFQITATNMDNEKVHKNVPLEVKNANLLLSTDKVKYSQGEDINLNTYSLSESLKNIYFFKNNKLIKMVSTDSSESTVNLGEIYGLIDIYVTDTNSTNYDYYNNLYTNNNAFKRTIFIKPDKRLNIAIHTDKEEYNPGENMQISFETKNEKESGIDAALLVSMLDNSILSLAENDLSIDNIRIALSDIQFSDELDAATLYSCIVDDKSEQTIMALLLKQGNKDINISETTINNYEEKEKAAAISILLIAVMAISVLIICSIKFKKFRVVLKHLLNLIIWLTTLITFLVYLFDEVLDLYIEGSIIAYIIISLIGIASYIALISKIEKKISRTSLSILIIAGISFAIAAIYSLVCEYEISVLCFIIPIVLAIIISMIACKKKNIKISNSIWKEIIYICMLIVVIGLALIIAIIFKTPAFCIIFAYLFNYLFNIRPAEKMAKKEKKETDTKNSMMPIVIAIIIVFACIGFIAVASFIYRRASNSLDTKLEQSYSSGYNSGNVRSGLSPADIVPQDAETAISNRPAFSVKSSILDGAMDLFDTAKSNSNSDTSKTQDYETTIDGVAELETNKTTADAKVRNVFLESMCFVPELVTQQGKANLDLTLSDNITTWTIQTVGNTKDGRIGYGMLDTVKVFQPFFVDFELPRNAIDGDEISIPVTIYNYTDSAMETALNIEKEDWFNFKENSDITVSVDAQASKLVYVPITIKKFGDYKFRVEAKGNNQSDIIEKTITISPKGYKVERVVSTGRLDENISEDLIILDEIVENTAKANVKIYASVMSQTVEGMENIFKMPTGCFEQVSSSLYPNILALKYLEDNGIVDDDLKNKALNYISSGYQKLLAYEVKGESGGYSLYGHSPAETVLTAYGLMELTDLSKVYKVDENVINKMNSFLYKKQNINGSFTITGSHQGGASSNDNLALNAYITWALSESNPKNDNLKKSIQYLKERIDKVDDNYTLALVANSLANVGDKEAGNVVKRLVNNVQLDGNNAYISSNITDYYGSRYNTQNIQTVALTSMALSKTSKNSDVNKKLVNYLITQKDTYGTWRSTQATILALKALNVFSEKGKLDNQTITVKVNDDEQKIEIKENPLDIYQLSFNNLTKENKLSIDIKKGGAYYEVVEEYYVPYDALDKSNDNIEIIIEANDNLSVNDILDAKIKLINKNKDDIYNGMVTIAIPQGFTTVENSLMELEEKGIIEKYETSYGSVNIYLRNFEVNQIIDLNVKFRAAYPVNISGLAVRAYDYYNPEVEGKSSPIAIKVN